MRWRKFEVRMPVHSFFDKASGFNGVEMLDAVFIPTRKGSQRTKNLVEQLVGFDFTRNIFVIGSTLDDIPSDNSKFTDLTKSFNSFSSRKGEWDLPEKRNFAINFSHINNFRKILLLDDDILFSHSDPKEFVRALDFYWVAGMYSIGEFDTSIVGSIGRNHGIYRSSFLSGNCLALNLEYFSPYFPDIYNEDWLALIPAVLNDKATLIGPVTQLEKILHDPVSIAKFQEVGEIIADHLYSEIPVYKNSHLSEGFCNYIERRVSWKCVVEERLDWLEKFSGYLKNHASSDVEVLVFKGLVDYHLMIEKDYKFLHKTAINILKQVMKGEPNE